MTRWRYTVEIKDLLTSKTLPPGQVAKIGKQIAARLRRGLPEHLLDGEAEQMD